MKRIFLFSLFILTIGSILLASDPESAVSTAKGAIGDYVLISGAICAVVLTISNGIKELLESPVLVWILKLIGHDEVVPFISVALTIVTAVIAGFVAYGSDGLTIAEIISIISGWLGGIGSFRLIKGAGAKA